MNNKNQSVKQLVSAFSIIILTVVCICAQKNQTRNTGSQSSALVGRWVSDEATVEIRADGTLTINGEEFSYKVKNSIITVYGEEGTMQFPFELNGDTMIVSVADREIEYRRAKGRNNPGGGNTIRGAANPQELVGKWCYMANVNGGSGNSRMSNRCFTLFANGTYEYYSETSTSVSNGSSASQEYDSGRWSATATTLTAYSKTYGTITYNLQKRNHPKTGDPMLIVDGDAYVTAYQRESW
jgi:hypothetical protein